MEGLRVVFMGTPGYAIPVLEAVQGLGCAVVAAYTAPDQPVGRGRRVRPTPVKAYALERGIPAFTPSRLSLPEERERFIALGAGLVVVAAYGLLLPKPFLFTPSQGALNVHPSLLPRHRGAAPVATAILAGDQTAGTTVMLMDEGMDTGPILAQHELPLWGNERTPELTERLFRLGAELLVGSLPRYMRGELRAVPQPEEGATVVRRFSKEDGALDWTAPAVELERQVRAFYPWPGSATVWEGRRLEVAEAAVYPGLVDVPPGTVIPLGRGAGVVTGDGVLELRRVTLEGRPPTGVEGFLRGHRTFLGARLPS